MAEDNFEEFLNRAEDDMEDMPEDDILADVDAEEETYDDEDDDLGGASLSGAIVSEEMKAQSLMVDMPSAHGEIVEGANGGEGTIVRSAYLGKEMQTSFLESVRCLMCATA